MENNKTPLTDAQMHDLAQMCMLMAVTSKLRDTENELHKVFKIMFDSISEDPVGAMKGAPAEAKWAVQKELVRTFDRAYKRARTECVSTLKNRRKENSEKET